MQAIFCLERPMTQSENDDLPVTDSPSDLVLAETGAWFAHLFGDDRDLRTTRPAHLDTARARRWFEAIGWGVETGHYTYQQPLERRSGPRVSVGGRELLLVSAYDYLGLIGHPVIEESAV